MEFPLQFSRWKGAHAVGTYAFGDDTSPPTAAPGTPGDGASAPGTKENLLNLRSTSNIGLPVRRVAVLWHGPGASADGNVTATLYFFEQKSKRWWRLGTADVPLKQDAVTYLDAIALVESPPTGENATKAAGASSQLVLIVKDVAAVTGEHLFLLGGDLVPA